MREGDRGSVLMLMPAAVLIFAVLGALCVDYGSVYVAERELSNAAAAASNDAATRAIDLEHLYATGEIRLIAARAWEVAEASVAGAGLERLDPRVLDVVVSGTTVTVTVGGRARHLFAGAVPGGPDSTDVSASSATDAADIGA